MTPYSVEVLRRPTLKKSRSVLARVTDLDTSTKSDVLVTSNGRVAGNVWWGRLAPGAVLVQLSMRLPLYRESLRGGSHGHGKRYPLKECTCRKMQDGSRRDLDASSVGETEQNRPEGAGPGPCP